jgi:riboflavin synthase
MFTGLVESIGMVTEVAASAAGLRLRVRCDAAPEASDGESVAVNGVCLTVVASDAQEIAFDVAPETMRVTTLGGLAAGSLVNIERSMRADARVGGHFVQGHVDAKGTLEAIVPEGDSYRLTFSVPANLMGLVVHKGSIAIDGVSLTVASIDDRLARFDVQIIPFTWRHTRFHATRPGDPVNVECDILGKYVARALELRGEAGDRRVG